MPPKSIKVERQCEHCHISFYIKPSKPQHQRGKFCSKICYTQFQRDRNHRVSRVCGYCSESFAIKRGAARRGQGKFCSRSCVTANTNYRHGLYHSPEYRCWWGMKHRCLYPNEVGYKNYGARGIKICDRWLNSFLTFYADMGPRPSPAHSIERLDTNANYEPANCVWATDTEQGRNRRNNRLITYNGETACMIVWSERTGISYSALKFRLKRGWSIEDALTQPPRPPRGPRQTKTTARSQLVEVIP